MGGTKSRYVFRRWRKDERAAEPKCKWSRGWLQLPVLCCDQNNMMVLCSMLVWILNMCDGQRLAIMVHSRVYVAAFCAGSGFSTFGGVGRFRTVVGVPLRSQK